MKSTAFALVAMLLAMPLLLRAADSASAPPSGEAASAQDRSSDSAKGRSKAPGIARQFALKFAQLAAKGGKAAKAPPAPPPDKADLAYGSHPNQRIDLWLAKTERPAPLAIFIHGGGFIGGDKSRISGEVVKELLAAGVSVAAINYRFRTEVPLPVILRDSARALQFLRSKADEFGVDKTRVACFGGSAGAGTSLWLAFRDDLADPQSEDPVARESTRISAAAATGCQATYDITKWPEILGSDDVLRFYPETDAPAFYGFKSTEELHTEAGRKVLADVDMLGMVSSDDPPVWLSSSDRHDALANRGDVNHAARHAIAVQQRCQEVGVPVVLKIGEAVRGEGESSQVDFMLKHLGVKLPADEKAAK
ncbi:MAG: alpha/beta hydrolase [Planctomycetota bacterium]